MAATKKSTARKGGYKEPDSYFPKEIRKQFELGEYNKNKPKKAKTTKSK